MRRMLIGIVALAVVLSVGGAAFADDRGKGAESHGFSFGIKIGDFALGVRDIVASHYGRDGGRGDNGRGRSYPKRDRIGRLIDVLRYARDDDDREDAAKALGKLRAPRAVSALIGALLHDREDDVREEAAKALGRIGDRDAVKPLRRASRQDRSRKVRRAAKKALKTILRDLHHDRDCDCGYHRDDYRGRDRDRDRDRGRDRDGPYFD